MNELRKIKAVYVTGNLIPIDRDNHNDYHPSNKKSPKTVTRKEKTKKSNREEFKEALTKYLKKNIYDVKEGKSDFKLKDKYDNLNAHMYCNTLIDINRRYYNISKKIRKVYKANGQKIKKIDSDTVVYNLIRNYINRSNVDSLFDIYATYNYLIDDIDYDYLCDFHVNIKGDIEKLRDGYCVKSDLRSPKYLSKKVGSGRRKIFELAFRLVTVSGEITCDMPKKKYLSVCNTKEEYLELYKILGGGVRRYMKYYEVSPLFEVFVKSVERANILSKLGYKVYDLDKDTILGLCAILFAQIIMGTYGTRKGIRLMLEVNSETFDRLCSLFHLTQFY